MSEIQMKLTGWKAIAAIVVVLCIVGVRLMTFNDKMDDSDLVQKLEFEIMTNYFPNDVEHLKSAYESGDIDETARAVETIATSKINFESIKASSPLLTFSTNKEVVIKVTYSLDDSSGNRIKETKYYLFKHGSIGNVWQYRYETSAISYFLNFK